MDQLTFLENPSDAPLQWVASRAAGLDRLDTVLPRMGRAYASTRNYDLGPANRSNVSGLSPWIRHRLLLEEEVVRNTLSRHSFHDAEKFIQEVFWRTYFKGWLEHRPTVWAHYRADVGSLLDQLDRDSGLRNRYETAISGETGIDCFDAWTAELTETGYLHNHARMWFASIWIFTLRLPWQLGADYFFRHLLDGDPASNTLSWRWVAGLHTKGKHYVARQSNIEKFTNGRFSPQRLVADPLPLAESIEHPVQPLAEVRTRQSGAPFGLVITEEDCSPETLVLPGNPVGICGLVTTRSRSPLPVGENAMAFTQQAVGDGIKRAEKQFDSFTSQTFSEDWGRCLIRWAQDLEVTVLITAWVPVGPVREILDEVRPVLEEAGISLIETQRKYDATSWPHATRGFFKLKQQIPNLVKTLGLN